MQYELTGRLCVRPCAGFEEPLDDATVRLYRAEDREGIVAATTARVKETFDLKTEERSSAPLAEDRTGDDGSFTLTFEEDDDFAREAVVLDALVSDPLGRDVEPVEVELTTLRPEWRQTEAGATAHWEHCLSEKQWCALLAELECWMVCGQVTVCDRDVPIPNATVTVFDADIVQADALGSDVTDANGRYVVYYSRADFERVPAPFSPIELRAGPDLFFEVASSGGNLLLDESPSDGRQPGREDVGHCAHVDVCAPIDVPEEGEPAIPTAWTKVGNAFTIPDGNSLNDFDDAGYAGALKFALTGRIRMTGSTPETSASGNQVEYRFLAAPSTASNTDPAMSASQFTDAVGDRNNRDLFAPIVIGQLVRFAPSFDIIPVRATLDSVDDDGWLNVSDAIDEAFDDHGITAPADRARYDWVDTDGLLGIRTTELTTEPDVPDSVAGAGEDIDPADRISIETFAFRFEAREVDPSTGSASNLPAHGQTLNRAVVNNNAAFRKMEIVQQRAAACDPITTSDVDVAYTVYHPHIRDAEIQLLRNDQRNDPNPWTDLHDPESSGSVDSEVSFYSSTLSGSALESMQDGHYNAAFDIAGEVTKECTYTLEMRTRLRLHNGDAAASWSRLPPISFYAE